MKHSLLTSGASAWLVTYEARTFVLDPESLRKFKRYWVFIRPFSGYMMRRALAYMRLEAEKQQAGGTR